MLFNTYIAFSLVSENEFFYPLFKSNISTNVFNLISSQLKQYIFAFCSLPFRILPPLSFVIILASCFLKCFPFPLWLTWIPHFPASLTARCAF